MFTFKSIASKAIRITDRHIQVLRFINTVRSLPSNPENADIAAELYAARMIRGHFSNGELYLFLTPEGAAAALQKEVS